jgi:hypothetical protein
MLISLYSWDTAFHCIPLAMVDPTFAKKQLDLMTREWYMKPDGALPAYEWNFSDVNPPVHAWATFRVFKIERKFWGREDLDFLERVFQKLLLNFTWYACSSGGTRAMLIWQVGQPQGRGRKQRLRGRVPGTGQHWAVQPLGAAAYWRDVASGGRHCVDGVLLLEHVSGICNRPGPGVLLTTMQAEYRA